MRKLALIALLLAVSPLYAQTSCPQLPVPVLQSPANGAIDVRSPITLQWGAVAGARNYEVWGAADGEDPFQVGETTTTTFIVEVTADTEVEWYVVAVFDNNCKTTSSRFRFTTFACNPPAPMLLSPVDFATTGSPVTFRWTPVTDVDYYRVWIYDEDDELWVAAETRRTEATARFAPGLYVWFIEAVFEECESSYSDEVFLFEVPTIPGCVSGEAVPVSPPNGSTQTSPLLTFTWNPVPGAIGYELWAALDDGEYEFIEATVGTSAVVRVTDGTISWVVVAQFNGCEDSVSDPFFFVVPYNEACDRGEPFPISPPEEADNVPTRVDFVWTPVSGAARYNVYTVRDEDLQIDAGGGGESVTKIGTSTTPRLTANVSPGYLGWAVEAEFNDCPPVISTTSYFEASASAACTTPEAPELYVEPQASSGDEFLILFLPGLNTSSYQIQESTNPAFTGATTRTISDILLFETKTVPTPTRFYYRVRSNSSCGLGLGPYSEAASIVVTPATAVDTDDAEFVSSFGQDRVVVQRVHIPGSGARGTAGKRAMAVNFTATTDQPWLTVQPSSGVLPPEGIDLVITADPKQLPVGSNTATLIVRETSGDLASNHTSNVPVSISLVTPVTPTAGTSPLPNSLIIPAVAHAEGANTTFESDVRIANASTQLMKYQLLFTPSNSDGTKEGQQATIQIEPGETTALNDILRNFYGYALRSDSVSGVLEIRPLSNPSGSSSSTPSVTFASSRTYATAPEGTYGQFIPAIPFSQFIGRGTATQPSVISLQQIAQSASYRTNVGLVEGSGQPASVLISVFGDRGEKLGDFPLDLKAGEHVQLNRYLDTKGISVTNGRLEVRVTTGTGRVTAYASVLDNRTNDPMLVMPVDPSQMLTNRTILPGIGDFNIGTAHWKSDVRLYNAGTTPVTATLTYFAQNATGSAPSRTQTIAPGQTLALDSIMQNLYSMRQTAGSLMITTSSESRLIATARTYTDVDGTYGQFIPGITSGEGVGLGGRALQILQVEESDRFRTNLGIVELTGNPVTVELTAVPSDSKIAAKTQVTLGPNQFFQINRVLSSLGLPTTYNARVTLKVVSGPGKIGGYASLIDNKTNDPTYVPAQ